MLKLNIYVPLKIQKNHKKKASLKGKKRKQVGAECWYHGVGATPKAICFFICIVLEQGSGIRFKFTWYKPIQAKIGYFLPTKCAHAQGKNLLKITRYKTNISKITRYEVMLE